MQTLNSMLWPQLTCTIANKLQQLHEGSTWLTCIPSGIGRYCNEIIAKGSFGKFTLH